jgi:hypothetical protein
MRTLLFASCAALLLLAGCTGTTTTTTGSGTTGPASGAMVMGKPEVVSDKGTITAGLGAGVSFTLGAAGAAPGVQGNVTLLYIELRWTGPVDLGLCVNTPSGGNTAGAANCDSGVKNGGLPGMPDSPVHATYVDPEQGDWKAFPDANGAAAQTDYELAVTLFHGEREVPAGYTAFT